METWKKGRVACKGIATSDDLDEGATRDNVNFVSLSLCSLSDILPLDSSMRIFAFSRCSCGGNSRAKGTLIKVGGAMHLPRICDVLAMHRRIFPAGENVVWASSSGERALSFCHGSKEHAIIMF